MRREPPGRNQYKPSAERQSAQARALLDGSATADGLAALSLSDAVPRLLPEAGATLEQALVAAMLTDALRGDAQGRRGSLARVWPAPKPVEGSAGEGVGRTLAELLKRARREREVEPRGGDLAVRG